MDRSAAIEATLFIVALLGILVLIIGVCVGLLWLLWTRSWAWGARVWHASISDALSSA